MIAKDVKDKNECFSCEEECLFVDLSVTYRLILLLSFRWVHIKDMI